MSPCCGQSDVVKPVSAPESSTLVVIQARLASERYPEKALADLCGQPLIQHVIGRARRIRGVADVLVAVPSEAVRQALIDAGITERIVAVSRVSENDVLGRFAWVAHEFQSHDAFVRLTADCPNLDVDSCNKVVARFLEGNLDYVSNMDDDTPNGKEPTCEIFSRAVLELADKEASTEFDREHVTSWIRNNAGQIDVVLPAKGAKTAKQSIDTPADLEALRKARGC